MLLSFCVLFTTFALTTNGWFFGLGYFTDKELTKLNIVMSVATLLLMGILWFYAFIVQVVYSHCAEMREKEERHNIPIPSAPLV